MFSCGLAASRFKIEKWKIKKRFGNWLRFGNEGQI
jgi:hypothetical protein